MKKLIQILDSVKFWHILSLALVLRLISVIFSKGFGFSDDHFEVVEIAQGMLDGKAMWATGEIYLFNLIYIGTHYYPFRWLELMGFHDPQLKMLLIRFLHAAWSMLGIWLLYQWVQRMNVSIRLQKLILLSVALFWFFPMMSVRSLREFVCITPLIWAFYSISKANQKPNQTWWWICAGLGFALAFVLRLQTAFFPIGVGLFLLFKQRWTPFLWLALATFLGVALTQGVFDAWFWGDALASVKAYIEYNAAHSSEYPNGPWYQYIFTLLGVSLPPLSLFLAFGFFYGRKQLPEVFWGFLCFFVFHSLFPNKQERFILPCIPFFLVLGVLGLHTWFENKAGQKAQTWVSVFATIAIVLNLFLLCLLTVAYSKKSRVEAVYALYLENKNHDQNLAVLQTHRGGIPMAPTFYATHPNVQWWVRGGEVIPSEVKKESEKEKVSFDYLLISGNEQVAETVKDYQTVFGSIQKIGSYEPGFVDLIAWYLNPTHNVNETWHLYQFQSK